MLGQILLGIVLTVGTGLFVAAEFALVATDPVKAERRAAEGDRRAGGVVAAMRHLSTQLSGAQVGITVTTILLGYTTQVALTDALADWLGSLGLAAAVATSIGVVAALVIVNAFSMVFGELVPKNLALSDPLRIAGAVVPLHKAFTWVFTPVIASMNAAANWFVRGLGVEPAEELSSARSASELAAIVRHSAEEGTLDTSTATLFTRSVAISDLTAVDVMQPRVNMVALPASATAQDVIERAVETGHSRFPVYESDPDDIIGLVHLRRAIAVPFERRGDVPVVSSSLLAEAPRVPETVALAPLLVALREDGLQMALVVDEYGGTSGVVTLEDVVEEIVGDVADEHDPRRRGVKISEDGGWDVAGTLRPDEISRLIGVVLPDDGPYETIAGLVLTELGRVPVVGDTVEVAGCRLSVRRTEGRRIAAVGIVPGEEVSSE
ncbi:HlyC/CorC family transporter [Nanchangia anserum]|uniref:HlyC/CorC family transporter n=1 Tax=Nanchangia anserum TaxID=2692125 RepID=A0A8I0GEI9_9ACTO|nr:hemolysin family protein [Nanchangia anserum]MBD3690048.1 HlyC/CorC family transporter [Nanchangia anserum]QOX82559.1 HlyC/CorC family transporter [Nanchangia anserum]